MAATVTFQGRGNEPAAIAVVAKLLGMELRVGAAKGSAPQAPVLQVPAGPTVTGDASGAEALAVHGAPALAIPAGAAAQWRELAAAIRGSASETGVLAALDTALSGRTFLCGARLTVADILVATALRLRGIRSTTGSSARWQDTCEAMLPMTAADPYVPRTDSSASAAAAPTAAAAASGAGGRAPGKAKGAASAAAAETTEAAPAAADVAAAASAEGEGATGHAAKKAGGKSDKVEKAGLLPGLPGWDEAPVVTRFPPEPSGYLHIGHIKAVTVNNYYARHYGGKLLLRFDDTNPSKEKEEFEEAIVADLARLEIQPDLVSHTSDHFHVCEEYARKVIRDGNAYMDDTPVEQMRAERTAGIVSKRKPPASDVATNLSRFEEMLAGTEEGQKWCLRANWNMADLNKCCRDPVLYRCNLHPHLRTGTRFKAYPTYDFACPIVDSIEGVTHALRTTEYRERDEQYARLQANLGVRKVRIIEFSRLNMTFTTLSKRKLTWFVEHGLVDGWNDPRFPTVQGVLRRGVQVEALRSFILSQGASKRDIDMEWDTFYATNKKVIEPMAHRFFAVDDETKVLVNVLNGPAEPEGFAVPLHPKDASVGNKVMFRARRIFIEGQDAEAIAAGEKFTLMRWSNAIAREVTKDAAGKVTSIDCEVFPEDTDFKSTKVKAAWVPDVPHAVRAELIEFDNLITKRKLEDTDKLEDLVNPLTKVSMVALCEPACRAISADQVIQIERRSFYRCDRAYVDDSRQLVLFAIPDGRTKPMSTLSPKLISKAQEDQARNRALATEQQAARASTKAAAAATAASSAHAADDGGASDEER